MDPSPILSVITGRNEVLAKVIFSQASVIHSVHGGGVLHQNTVNVRPVRILLECILIHTVTISTMLNFNCVNNEHGIIALSVNRPLGGHLDEIVTVSVDKNLLAATSVQ